MVDECCIQNVMWRLCGVKLWKLQEDDIKYDGFETKQ